MPDVVYAKKLGYNEFMIYADRDAGRHEIYFDAEVMTELLRFAIKNMNWNVKVVSDPFTMQKEAGY